MNTTVGELFLKVKDATLWDVCFWLITWIVAKNFADALVNSLFGKKS